MIGSAASSRAERDVEAHRGRIERAARFERGAEEFDVVSDL